MGTQLRNNMKNINDIDLNKIIEEYNNLNEYQKKNILDPNIADNQTQDKLKIIKDQLYKNNQDNITEMFELIFISITFCSMSLGVMLPIALVDAGIITAGLATGLGIPLSMLFIVSVPLLITYISDSKNDNSYVSNLVRDIYSKNAANTIRSTYIAINIVLAFSAFTAIKVSGPLSLFIFAASGPAAAILGITAGVLIYKYYSNKNENLHLSGKLGQTEKYNMLSGSNDMGIAQGKGITHENTDKHRRNTRLKK